jgi:cysteinyl-tRNA synthetase
MTMPSRLSVYNTLSHSKEKFVPLPHSNPMEVKMFVCGQTVYDDAHLGHAKNYIDFDIIARWLRHEGYKLTYVQNITDVEDKIIARAEERNIPAEGLAKLYEKRFLEDMEVLGVKQDIDMYPRTHDYIKEIAMQTQLLLDKGYAYLSDGDVYYDVDKFKDYTKLSGMKLGELTRHRIEAEEGKKKQYDFIIWKAAKPGEPNWKIKVTYKGKEIELDGRPGWHIEDTATTNAIFGPQYDIHGGATELIFPHHTNEIALAEAAFGKKPFVKYWLHTGVLNIKGQKMSKSLHNFITIRDALKKYDPEAIRFMVASSRYRSPMEYSDMLMKSAASKLNFLYASFGIFYNMKEVKEANTDSEALEIANKLEKDFSVAMNNDFDTPLSLSALWDAITKLRKLAEANKSIGKEAKSVAISKVLEFAKIFGIMEHDWYKEPISEEALEQIHAREELRKEKKFKEADEIRAELSKKGIALEDTEYGPVWYFEKRLKKSN